MDHLCTETRVPGTLDAGFILDRLVRIGALGNVISQLCREELDVFNVVALAEVGKVITEEAGMIISQVELIPDGPTAQD